MYLFILTHLSIYNYISSYACTYHLNLAKLSFSLSSHFFKKNFRDFQEFWLRGKVVVVPRCCQACRIAGLRIRCFPASTSLSGWLWWAPATTMWKWAPYNWPTCTNAVWVTYVSHGFSSSTNYHNHKDHGNHKIRIQVTLTKNCANRTQRHTIEEDSWSD